jgi:hypothetical protein
MHEEKAKDAERIRFVAPPGSATLYAEVAALEQIPVDAWMSGALHAAAAHVLEAHGRGTAKMPAPHLKRPPRLQPRMKIDDDGEPG